MIKYFILSFALLAGNEKVIGHMQPMQSELLKNPIYLDCGAVIREYRGSKPSRHVANSLCTSAKRKFVPFVLELNYVLIDADFNYDISIIPGDQNYRSLNDEEYRFQGRNDGPGFNTGYTSFDSRILFCVPPIEPDFEITFLHELFHAMSHHYGVLYQHPGKTLAQKIEYDEELAQKFTTKYWGKK